ncbi:hypothetical protein EDC91_102159 [Shewanella fodinae]|uniref:Uncharacterized protein n=1 Tax=Shewanella fodinae TaxID=552357 RepID=A0A4R2FMK7_9GAMM|nr:hypothetical protein EDC91_102159 [Shewanella fodinae]
MNSLELLKNLMLWLLAALGKEKRWQEPPLCQLPIVD